MVSAGDLKAIHKTYEPPLVGEGDGARVLRFIGGSDTGLPTLDPFLMLDLSSVKLPNGFPDHPHRGFDTVAYLVSGKKLHEDFKGHKGELNPGDVQWMTAGRGIVHAEMPASFDEPARGFALWINLPAVHKFCDPQYQEFTKDQIPDYKNEENGMSAKVISGDVFDVHGPIVSKTPTYLLDFRFATAGTKYDHKIPAGWNSMLVIFEGAAKVQDTDAVLNSVNTAVFEKADVEQVIRIEAAAENTRVLLLAGQPLNEPIAWKGPFVLNTPEELAQAREDFDNCKNGFEARASWNSEIKNLKFGRTEKQE